MKRKIKSLSYHSLINLNVAIKYRSNTESGEMGRGVISVTGYTVRVPSE